MGLWPVHRAGPLPLSYQDGAIPMLRRVVSLFNRYANQHQAVRLPGVGIWAKDKLIGAVDYCMLRGGGAQIVGWTTAETCVFGVAGKLTPVRPSIRREDVVRALGKGTPTHTGFEFSLPEVPDQDITLNLGDASARISCLAPVDRMPEWRSLWLLPAFIADMTRAAPSILRWYLWRDITARSRVKRILGFQRDVGAGLIDVAALAPTATTLQRPADTVTIVIPVYNSFDLLPELLRRVSQNTDLAFRVVIVEDCSTDDRVLPFIRAWAADALHPVEIVTNDNNLGFVQSINRGLARAADYPGHVVVLNSDAMVPSGWASRLLTPIVGDDSIATVTPLSNDAEILSVPSICTKTDLLPGQCDAIDGIARRLRSDGPYPELPTGIGFCMAINRGFLGPLPGMDTIFGRGYGEEVDWCLRARALGGRNILQPALFVEHRGAASFGSAEREMLVSRHNRILSSRYPGFDAEVQSFITSDPAFTQRFALAIGWLASKSETAVPIYIAHSLGGGAETYLADRLARESDASDGAIILRVGGARQWRIEMRTPLGLVAGSTDDTEAMLRLLDPIQSRHVVYSCAVGHPDPASIPTVLRRLLDARAARLEFLFHDYFAISPSYTLLDSTGRFWPVDQIDPWDAAHCAKRPCGDVVDQYSWSKDWGSAIALADEVVLFSQDSVRHVLQAFPDIADKVHLRPHVHRALPPVLECAATDEMVIGVLGSIGLQKGAGVVIELGKRFERAGKGSVVVIGDLDPAYEPGRNVRVHGAYTLADLPALARHYGISHWLIPSIWPETFSYTTHEAIATGLPVYCFDLGAQAETLRQAKNGTVLPVGQDPAGIVLNALTGPVVA